VLTNTKILVTSALPYANGPIHLGHLAGAYLPADIFVRYHRLCAHHVLYICGSDEHGVPIMLRARSENRPPQEIVDHYHELNKKSFTAFGMSFDYYGRTTTEIHRETSQDFFRRMADKNIFILNNEEQLYDPEAKIFLADRFVRGTCPYCDYADAYGDQCEKCGSSLNSRELRDPRSAITNAKPVYKKTTHWYLPLAKFQNDLEKWITQQKGWKSNVLGQIQSWFKEGLKDRAVTRDLSWGVPVPEDVASKLGVEAKGKVLYVWFDAPIGYISATKEWAIKQGMPDAWKAYWQDKKTRLIHFIGKDNIVFHCIIFPAMLMAMEDYVLPQNVPANEFLNLEGEKLSTSRNYAVWLDDYLKKFEADSLRYCLANNLPETKDSDFSWKEFQARHNNELADILGNFINRTLTFVHRNFAGKVPAQNRYDARDKELINLLAETPTKVGNYIDTCQLRQAVKEIMDLARFANKYFNDQEPWVTLKANRQKCATTLALCLETIKTLSILCEPVLPFTAKKMRRLLNYQLEQKADVWHKAGLLSMASGHKLNEPEILFQKIEDDIIASEIQKLKNASAGSKEEKTEKIDLDTLKKVELKIAEIIAAEAIKKSDKLLKLQVKTGQESRQIIAGIAQHYDPSKLLGKKIVIVANLMPATLFGEVSEGMLLAARYGNDLALLTVDEDLESGAEIS
jgi:methionyl-tRNA synthetase